MSSTFVLTGVGSEFTIRHNSIILDPNKNYEAALLSLDSYNSIPNITKDMNNIFKYSNDNGVTWKVLELDTGSYEIEALSNEIQRLMVINGDYDRINEEFYITITPNTSKLTSIINITQSNYKVDFTVTNSFADLLGFEKIVINAGYNESTEIVDIISTNSILVNIDIVAGSYINGTPLPVIYSFYPNVPPGYKIVERPNPQLIYHPISRNDISIMRVWLTNQDNKPVDLRGETLTVRIIVREVQDIQNILRELFNYIKK